MSRSSFGLGRREPQDNTHVARFPFRLTQPKVVEVVEKSLVLPKWIPSHNQGAQGACVGFGVSLMMSIKNDAQCRAQGDPDPSCRYNPWLLWNAAKEIDEFPDTAPGDDNGTTVRAACDVLRHTGHWVWNGEQETKEGVGQALNTAGVSANRWATNTDEIRTAISEDNPVAIGVNWYSGFNAPEQHEGEFWIGRHNVGKAEGGHCVCIVGASDQRQAFQFANSWGESYPVTWLPYTLMERLLNEAGEAVLISDR